MTRHERIIVGLAVQVLHQAAATAADGCADRHEVRLALRCLRRHCPDDRLVDFWHWARQLPNANRAANCAASLADILAALDASGAWPGDEDARRAMLVDTVRIYGGERDRLNKAKRTHYWRPPAPRR